MKKLRIRLPALALSLALLAGCAPAKTEDTVRIATKPMTEQFIVGEMLKAMIEQDTGLKVELTKGIGGGTGNIQPAMEKGDFDLYPEYTSTGWQYVLKHTDLPGEEALFRQLQEEYRGQFGFEWVGMYGFSDMFGLVVRREIAQAHGIKTYSDLAPHAPGLVFGAEYDFYERDDGFDALSETYGLRFKSTADMDIGLKCPAINAGEVDVMDVFTTDGQLSTADVILLEDDKGFFLPAYCGTVVRSEALEKHPGLREVLQKFEGLISTKEMTGMNYAVEQEGKEDKAVALEFLRQKGLLNA